MRFSKQKKMLNLVTKGYRGEGVSGGDQAADQHGHQTLAAVVNERHVVPGQGNVSLQQHIADIDCKESNELKDKSFYFADR